MLVRYLVRKVGVPDFLSHLRPRVKEPVRGPVKGLLEPWLARHEEEDLMDSNIWDQMKMEVGPTQ